MSASTLASLKPHCNVLNFARGGAAGASAVDGAALRVRCDRGAIDLTLISISPSLILRLILDRRGTGPQPSTSPPHTQPPTPPHTPPPYPLTLIFTLSPGMTLGSSAANTSATTPMPPCRITPVSCACPRSAMPPTRRPTTARRWRLRSSRAFWRRVTQLVGKGAAAASCAAASWRHSAAAQPPGRPAASDGPARL